MKEAEVRKLCKRILTVLGYDHWWPKPTYLPSIHQFRAQDIFGIFDGVAVKPGRRNMQIQITTGYDGGTHRRKKIVEHGFKHDLDHNEITVWSLIHKGRKERYFLVHKIAPTLYNVSEDCWVPYTKFTVTRITAPMKFYAQLYIDGKYSEQKFEYEEDES